MAFISRLRETPRSPGEARDVSNLDAVRRSYRAMKVLMRRTPTVDNFIAARLKEISMLFIPLPMTWPNLPSLKMFVLKKRDTE